MGSRTSRTIDPAVAADLASFQRLGAGGSRLLVRFAGEIDLATTPAMAAALDLACSAATRIPEIAEIEIDLRAVEFLGASGLAALVDARHRCDHAGVALRVVADHSVVTRPIRLTRLDQPLGLHSAPAPRAPAGVTRASPGRGAPRSVTVTQFARKRRPPWPM